jgi:dihydropteroate synthase
MDKYYTKPCNFYFGKQSKRKIQNNLSLPFGGTNNISFDSIEIISRKKIKLIHYKKINSLNKNLRKKINMDISNIVRKKKFRKLQLTNTPLLMGVINMTPDSFSDGGKFNKTNSALDHAKYLIKKGCKIIDVGGESTRPGAKEISVKSEWKRIKGFCKRTQKLKCLISIDTRKSQIMDLASRYKVDLVNDISGLNFDKSTIKFLKRSKKPFVIHHSRGLPKNMQKKPNYKNVLLDIYDFFEDKLKTINRNGIKHKNIILDPGIGFGKNLKHNITILKHVSIFHSLGYPVMLGISRKRFIKDLVDINDSKERIGGTISSSIWLMMQGVQILRVHDVNEINQAIKVFKSLKFK